MASDRRTLLLQIGATALSPAVLSSCGEEDTPSSAFLEDLVPTETRAAILDSVMKRYGEIPTDLRSTKESGSNQTWEERIAEEFMQSQVIEVSGWMLSELELACALQGGGF